jgi:hypothetical protein
VSEGRGGLNRRTILRALERLSEELERRSTRAELFMVGGGAMALAYARRRTTRDLDAIFVPKAIVYEAARRVAEDLSLPEDWLNDAVKSFAPGDDPERKVVFRTAWLTVSVASPRYLLAMKLLAARVDQDTDDIVHLYRLCGFTTAGEGMDLVEAFYPDRRIEPRTQFLLEELFGASPSPPRNAATLEIGAATTVASREGGPPTH